MHTHITMFENRQGADVDRLLSGHPGFNSSKMALGSLLKFGISLRKSSDDLGINRSVGHRFGTWGHQGILFFWFGSFWDFLRTGNHRFSMIFPLNTVFTMDFS